MKRFAPLLIALATACSAPASVPPPPPESNPDEAEVLAAVAAMYDDLSNRRWDALAAHFLEDASLVFAAKDGPRRQSPSKFIELVRKNVEGKDVFDERMREGRARVHGKVAHVWSRFVGREGKGAEVRSWSGVDAFTLMKVGGHWKIVTIAVSYDP